VFVGQLSNYTLFKNLYRGVSCLVNQFNTSDSNRTVISDTADA